MRAGLRALAIACVAGTFAAASCEAAQQPPPEPDTDVPDQTPWPAPQDPLARTVEAGLEPATHEFLDHHFHSHLDVFVDGVALEVPAGIGIETDDPAVRIFEDPEGTSYGGIDPPCEQPCISPLHTHAPDGVLHTESAEATPNTLGQFFVEWDVRLDDRCVGEHCEPQTPIEVFVDGEAYEGDPADIELTDGLEIAIVIGASPAEIPSAFPGA